MLFTTKTEYGLRAMVALAKNYGQKPLSLAQIAISEHISQGYLERIFTHLKADDLVVSVKGSSGGYALSRLPKKISIFETIECLEGPLVVFYCLSGQDKKIACCSPRHCQTKRVWHELQVGIIRTLRKFSLADLI